MSSSSTGRDTNAGAVMRDTMNKRNESTHLPCGTTNNKKPEKDDGAVVVQQLKQQQHPHMGESLKDLYLTVPTLSLEPMSGITLVERIRDKTTAVDTRYLPCVFFYIYCQDEVFSFARLQECDGGTTSTLQFFERHVARLPAFFKEMSSRWMENSALEDASQGLEQLVQHAKRFCSQGIMQLMTHFLGGLQEGRPFGLRQWLSQHGQVLSLCANFEGMFQACVKLDPSQPTTREMAELIRPMTLGAWTRLNTKIPPSYHKYLPSFSRLVADLSDMSSFNCIVSDDDIEHVEEVKKPTSASNTTHEIICIDDDTDSDDAGDDDDEDDDEGGNDETLSKAASFNDPKMIGLTGGSPDSAASDSKGFYKAVVESKAGGPVTVKRSLRLRH